MTPALSRSLLLLTLAACATTPTAVRPTCPSAENTEYFLLRDSLEKNDEFRRGRYSRILLLTGEPSLSCGMPIADESYRFTWLLTNGPPTTIRITRTGQKTTMHSRILSGAAGYNPGILAQSADVGLTIEEWERLNATIQSSEFWKLSPWEEVNGADGSRWIIEGQSSG